ncbi:hypothetical protein PINS_up022902 [Pythium insidiosum]|nr:hypothetical protein PINS_up022902 [Pythium insidiosum]
MSRHPDVFHPLGYSPADVTHALRLGEGSPAFQRMANDLLNVFRQPPLGISHADRGATSFVWSVGNCQIRAAISNRAWDFGARCIIQANRVNLPFRRILPLGVAKVLRAP